MLIRNFKIIFLISFVLSDDTSSIANNKIICGEYICHPEGGLCQKNDKCICFSGYTTILPIDKNEHIINCNYLQISGIKAGLIEMIIGCGFGHFYAKRILNGTIKLLSVSILLFCCVYSFVLIKRIREETDAEDHPYVSILFMLSILFKIFIVIWQIVDGILFFFKAYKDGNGIDLY
jgi:hypothetical protein